MSKPETYSSQAVFGCFREKQDRTGDGVYAVGGWEEAVRLENKILDLTPNSICGTSIRE